jgi:ribosomal protein S27AE
VTRKTGHRSRGTSRASIASTIRSEGVNRGRRTCRRNTITLMAKHRDLRVLRIRRGTETGQTQQAPDKQETQRAHHHKDDHASRHRRRSQHPSL